MAGINRRSFLGGTAVGAGAVLGLAGAGTSMGRMRLLVDAGGQVPERPLLEETLTLVLLGTGIPAPSIHRSRPAQVVLAGKKAFLVDCGAGATERLVRAGIPPSRVLDVFFTHHHSDHNSGFADFFVSSWGTGLAPTRSVPLNVYGPTNTQEIMGRLMSHLEWDISLRIQQARFPSEGAQIRYLEKNDGVIYDQEGVKVTVFTVDHGIVKPAVGYRFDYNGRSIVLSGDTRPCDAVRRFSENADVLVHEAYSRDWIDRALREHATKEEKAEGIMAYHSSTLEVAEIARDARVGHLVFTHLMPSPSPVWYFERDWVKGVSDFYKGKVTVGRDLMVI